MIVTSRFYCVSCRRVLSVDKEYKGNSLEEESKVSDDLSYEQSISRMKDLHHAMHNQIFRTGFYRNEMPLGYCGCCRKEDYTHEVEHKVLPDMEENKFQHQDPVHKCVVPANIRDRFTQVMLH